MDTNFGFKNLGSGIKVFFLSRLLFRANRETKSEYFYAVKNKLLAKYGKHIDYDVQYIEGKRCFSCGGTGIYHGYSQPQDCYRCYGGWYKLPTWNILSRVQFGNYIFHQPYKRVYKKPEIEKPMIEGYIEKTRVKYGELSLFILCLIYEKGYLKRWWSAPTWWRCYWYYPRNWFHNIIHIIKNGKKSYPAISVRDWWKKESGYVRNVVYDYNFFVGRTVIQEEIEEQDLPF